MLLLVDATRFIFFLTKFFVIAQCVAGHRLCNNCRGDGRAGHCRKCGRDTTFVHGGPDLDVYMAGFRVPCPVAELEIIDRGRSKSFNHKITERSLFVWIFVP
jgi:hypothetical protein